MIQATMVGGSSILAGAINGAIIGAAMGAITAAVTGGEIWSGVLVGAVGGAVMGGISGALNPNGFMAQGLGGKAASTGGVYGVGAEGAPMGSPGGMGFSPEQSVGVGVKEGGLSGSLSIDATAGELLGKGLESGAAAWMQKEQGEAQLESQMALADKELANKLAIMEKEAELAVNYKGGGGSDGLAVAMANIAHDKWKTQEEWKREDTARARIKEAAGGLQFKRAAGPTGGTTETGGFQSKPGVLKGPGPVGFEEEAVVA